MERLHPSPYSAAYGLCHQITSIKKYSRSFIISLSIFKCYLIDYSHMGYLPMFSSPIIKRVVVICQNLPPSEFYTILWYWHSSSHCYGDKRIIILVSLTTHDTYLVYCIACNICNTYKSSNKYLFLYYANSKKIYNK